MYCLEKDKRGEENKVDTQYQNLKTYDVENQKTYDKDIFEDGFYIPENIVVIGTMNDIDRSVESMDFALRRRFEFNEFRVDDKEHSDLLEAFFKSSDSFVLNKYCDELIDSIIALNQTIITKGKKFGLNRHYSISQGQFANISGEYETKEDILDYVWKYRIESLLYEYVRGEDEGDVEEFITACKKSFLE